MTQICSINKACPFICGCLICSIIFCTACSRCICRIVSQCCHRCSCSCHAHCHENRKVFFLFHFSFNLSLFFRSFENPFFLFQTAFFLAASPPLRLSASYIRTSSFEKNVKDAFLPLLQSGFSSRRHRFCRLSVSGDISKNEAKKRSLTTSSSPAYSFKKKRYRSFAAI